METQFENLHPAVQVTIIIGAIAFAYLWFKFIKEMSE